MARPKKNPDEQRKKRIPVAFSSVELFRVKESAIRERIPVSTWIRNKILGVLNGKNQASKK